MASAFQQNGFQLNAFQIAFQLEYAFQKCAFQYGAFQVEQCDTEWVYYPAPRGPAISARPSANGLRASVMVPSVSMIALGDQVSYRRRRDG